MTGALSRRRFLLGVTGSAAALCTGRPAWLRAAATAADPATAPAPGRTLVLVQLAGGNDGLNTIVPFRDPLYAKLRPAIALTEGERLPLSETLGFHGAMERLQKLFTQGKVAVVQGVGYPRQSRSHFEATAIWQTARLNPIRDPAGWLGRSIDALPGDPASKAAPRAPAPGKAPGNPLLALSIGGGGLSPALQAQRTQVPSLGSLDAFAVQPDRRYPGDAAALKAAMAQVYQGGQGPPAGKRLPPSQEALRFIYQVGQTALRSSEALRAAVTSYDSKVSYPKGGFGDQLRLTSQIIAGGLGTRVFHITLSGFDTHANQKGQHKNLLGQLSDGIAALLEDAAAHGFADRLAVMTYSEFGRRTAENGSAGTDHGAASPLFLVGERVSGGLYGTAPDLVHLSDGDVAHGVDFRDVYAAVLRDFLGVPPDAVLGEKTTPLPLFKT
jgi:uncharacterized protein (DUF1501 family)